VVEVEHASNSALAADRPFVIFDHQFENFTSTNIINICEMTSHLTSGVGSSRRFPLPHTRSLSKLFGYIFTSLRDPFSLNYRMHARS
jgi:hypothetical protein